LDVPGQTNTISIILSSNVTELASLRGRVFEPDAVTPHAGARVFVGRFDDQGRLVDVVAAVTADSSGFWNAENFPSGVYDVAAVSFDGQRKGDRRNIQVSAASATQVSITLNGRTTVSGRVEFFNGVPAPNALVAGGDAIVRADGNGLFTLTGVPTGQRTISAGLERDPANGIDFPRLGSATLNVLAGIDNFAVIRLRPAGRITGRVLDALGLPVPNARVAIPQEGGFMWTDADASGNYVFENLGLDDYTLSAPAPSAAQTDTTSLVNQIRDGTEDQVRAAIGEAFQIFSGVNDPFLNQQPFNPVTWGFVKTRLSFDGETAVADIRLLRPGTVSGQVLNGQGVPIGAKVRLTRIGPAANGAPSFVVRGEMNSDAALGTFAFTNAVLAGSFGLQAASPFFPSVISSSGVTTSTEPDSTNNVLQFPATREINGRLSGTVFNPDGSPAGSNVNVKISFGQDFVIRTGTNGFYDTQIALRALGSDGRPGVGYMIEADDPASGLRGSATVTVLPGITNTGNVILLGKGSLEIRVTKADGSPAPSASIEVTQGTFPNETFSGSSDTNGILRLENIFAGAYAVAASLVSGPSTLSGRAGGTVFFGQNSSVIVALGPSATIRGRYVKTDLATPVAFAQIAIGSVGFTTSDESGNFEVSGIPLGTYRLRSEDPVTGIGAAANVTLSTDGEVRSVILVEQSRGEVRGTVIDGYGTAPVPGANVTLHLSDGLTADRNVTTAPDGSFSFPGTPADSVSLLAVDPATDFKGSVSGTVLESNAVTHIDISLQPLARLAGVLFEPDGITPATNASVQIVGAVSRVSDTDASGRVRFVDLPLGDYQLRGDSRRTGATHSAVMTNISLNIAGNAPDFSLRLSGSGSVSGTVFLSDGTTPAPAAEVVLNLQSPLFTGEEETKFTSASGQFTFTNVAVGSYTLSAKAAALGASVSGSILTNGEADVLNVVLGASGSVSGRVVRADGTNAVPGADVILKFETQSGLPGIAAARTGSDGVFSFSNIPVGAFSAEINAPAFNGIARLSSTIPGNGQTRTLGDVPLDEENPRVIRVDPPNGTAGVPINSTVTLTFSESIDTNSINSNPVFLRNDTNEVPASILLLSDTTGLPRIIRVVPLSPLVSERTYQVVVIDGDRQNATGDTIASGPLDLVGRPLAAPFVAAFTTADNDPPLLVSQFPTNAQVQVDPRSVLRLTFNEPVLSSNVIFALSGPRGPVSGKIDITLNGLAVTFSPDAPLDPNTDYNYSLGGVRDLAGNAAVNQPITAAFSTLDTLGPIIASLRLANNAEPVAGATVLLEALLATNEPGASVRFIQDFNPTGTRATPPFSVPVTLPASGNTTFRAIATDRFANDGPLAELVVAVQSNQPPVVSLQRGIPSTGSLSNGQAFSIVVSATDDVGVTNIAVAGVGPFSFFTNLTAGTSRTLAFVVPGSATAGGLFQFRAQATDSLGLKSDEAILDLTITNLPPDTRPVQLTSVVPPSGASNQTLWLEPVIFHFDEPLNAAAVTNIASTVLVTNNAAVTTPFTLSLTNGGRDLVLALTRPLRPGVAYTNILLPGITDAASNVWQNIGGTAVPDSGVPFMFTTAAILPSTPASGTRVLPGQPVTVTANYEAGLGANFFRFQINSNAPVQAAAGAESSTATLTVPTNATEAVIKIVASLDNQFSEPFVFPPVVLSIIPAAEDSDGDGIPDSFEIANGLNPLVNDAALDPDGDGLSNLAEFQKGTNPHKADTDGDGIPDGVDPRPLLANHPPAAIPTLATNADGSVLITLGGSDADGDPLTAQLTALPLIGRIFSTTNGTTVGPAITNLPASISGSVRQVIYRPLGVASTNQLRYELNDRFTNSLEAVVTLVSTNNPGSDIDGDGMPDVYEIANGLDPFFNDAALDLDGDTLSNFDEFKLGTAPNRRDTDADGLDDAKEIALGTLPLDPDTDHDGILDGIDPNPFTANDDFDGDGIADADDPDIDGDGLSNTDELALGTDPRNPDTDRDGWRDGVEVEAGSNPLLASSVPVLFQIAAPEVGLILPSFAAPSGVTNGITFAQPEVGLILPSASDLSDLTNGVTAAQPEVGLILPASANLPDIASGTTVAEPEVGLILPGNVDLPELLSGLTLAQPAVGFILPANIDAAPLPAGVTVAEPAVTLQLQTSQSPPPNESAQSLPAVTLGSLQIQSASGSVLLEWSIPASGAVTVETSTDLETWRPAPVEILSSENGTLRVRSTPAGAAGFYRLRLEAHEHAP
jgi:hypothetical protein